MSLESVRDSMVLLSLTFLPRPLDAALYKDSLIYSEFRMRIILIWVESGGAYNRFLSICQRI